MMEDAIVYVSGAIAEKVAEDVGVPKDYVKVVMTKAASRARRLLNVIYDVKITISIPATEVDGEIAIAQLSNPANSGTMADYFASSLGSMPELTLANGGVEVKVSVELKVLNVPESLKKFVKDAPTPKPPPSVSTNAFDDADGLPVAAIAGGIGGALSAGCLIGLVGYIVSKKKWGNRVIVAAEPVSGNRVYVEAEPVWGNRVSVEAEPVQGARYMITVNNYR